MNGPFRFEKSIVFLLLLAVLSSCSPKKTDPVRSMPGTDEALTEEASAGGGSLYETIADPNTSYAAYTLDQGAVSFFLPEDWDLYMDGGSVLAFQKGSAYFQAERVRADGEEKSLHEVINQARSVEDQDLQFCVYCYNVQPGIDIDYSDGSSRGKGYMGSGS